MPELEVEKKKSGFYQEGGEGSKINNKGAGNKAQSLALV